MNLKRTLSLSILAASSACNAAVTVAPMSGVTELVEVGGRWRITINANTTEPYRVEGSANDVVEYIKVNTGGSSEKQLVIQSGISSLGSLRKTGGTGDLFVSALNVSQSLGTTDGSTDNIIEANSF
jgi:hypothetical protein